MQKFLLKISTQKISEKDAKKLHSDLIATDIIELENTKGKGKKKRENILNVLENLESVYNGGYLHYKGLPSKLKSESESESESKGSIVEKTKLRRQRFDEIANQEKMIHPELFKEYFEYLSPSKMYNALSDTKNTKKHKKT